MEYFLFTRQSGVVFTLCDILSVRLRATARMKSIENKYQACQQHWEVSVLSPILADCARQKLTHRPQVTHSAWEHCRKGNCRLTLFACKSCRRLFQSRENPFQYHFDWYSCVSAGSGFENIFTGKLSSYSFQGCINIYRKIQ